MQGKSKSVANFERPKYSACEFGKGHLRPDKIKTNDKNHIKYQELNKDCLITGKTFSEYHYISWAPGRFYNTKGDSDM